MAPNLPRLTPTDFATKYVLPDWRIIQQTIEATFRAGSFRAGSDLTSQIASAADELDHHPDIDLRYPGVVRVAITTHASKGLTDLDAALATRISALARGAGATAEPTRATHLELAIDALHIAEVLPFWRAALAYRDGLPTTEGVVAELVDPLRLGPPLWFQQMDAPRPQRNRVHLDILVAHDEAAARIAAALAAGGRLLSDTEAPAFWVLADCEGNEACICTWQNRD
jgi:4a-hydroxytetrahydrobiopterin dehydratase